MHWNKSKFERSSSLVYYHIGFDLYWETKHASYRRILCNGTLFRSASHERLRFLACATFVFSLSPFQLVNKAFKSARAVVTKACLHGGGWGPSDR